jgi:hypothetical protein
MTDEQRREGARIVQSLRSIGSVATDSAIGAQIKAKANELSNFLDKLDKSR